MRRRHFDTLRPICPVCRAAGHQSHLRIATVAREEDGHILEGVLHCGNETCLREFPIIDGIPLIVANIRQYVSDYLPSINARDDLSALGESLLGDCCGPESLFDRTRQHLSSYAWDHYGDLDPEEAHAEPRPGSMLCCLETGRQLAGSVPAGPILDVGCSVGRGSFDLASHTGQLVLGVDMNYPMLRLASNVLRTGAVRYPRRRVGLVYDRREFPVEFAHRENVDFWACDAAALPFASATFSLASAMNVLDCVYAPAEFLASLARVLRDDGKAVLSCPYDWSPAATALEAWVGGHSQRSPRAGSSEAVLRMLLTPGEHPSSVPGFRILAERDGLPWHVRLHDRSAMSYKVHLVCCLRSDAPRPLTDGRGDG